MILGKDDPTRMKGIWSHLLVLVLIHIFFIDCIAIIRDKTGQHSEQERLNAFDELEMIVEGIDNASNMERMNLWPEIFACISPEESFEVVKFALWIIGTCAQNNPETQSALLKKHHIFSKLLALWKESSRESSQIQPKIMYCLSSMLSNCPEGLEDFVTRDGFKIIDNFDGVVKDKMKFLLRSVLANEIGAETVRCLLKDCKRLIEILDGQDQESESGSNEE